MITSLPQIRDRWGEMSPAEIIRRACDGYAPDVAMSSSFQTQSVPLLHMVARVAPELPIIFLDTGYHFPETLRFRDRLVDEWGLNLQIMSARMSRDEFIDRHGHDLYRRDPDLCCYINKVEPMERATRDLEAWISGIRRDQTEARASIDVVEENGDDLVRVHPLADWTSEDVEAYRRKHDLPEHPLTPDGYASIGCMPCTDRPSGDGPSDRTGRWSDRGKTECGLHTELRDDAPDQHSS